MLHTISPTFLTGFLAPSVYLSFLVNLHTFTFLVPVNYVSPIIIHASPQQQLRMTHHVHLHQTESTSLFSLSPLGSMPISSLFTN